MEILTGCATGPAAADPRLGQDLDGVLHRQSRPPCRTESEEGWKHIGWHEIERGGWNAELRKLSWVLHAAPGKPSPRGSLELLKPGRLPELFRERISATIAIERFVPLVGERGVTITARRDLGASGTVAWHSTLTRGLSWETDGVRAAVDQAMEELRTEYDVG